MKTTRTRQWFRSVALGCAMAAGATAFGYDDGGRYVAETETFAEPTPLEGDVWIGNDNAGVFTEDLRFVWASADGLNAGATLTGWLRVADWNGTEEKPLYGSFEITGGSYSAAGFQVGGDYTEFTHAWATLTDGQLTVGKVNVGSSNEKAGEADLTLAGGSLVVGENGIVGAGTFNLNGGTLTTPSISGVALVVNGGTFANDTDATITSAVMGEGTLTKTGTGALTITGDVSGFTGTIAVAAEAGSVTVGEGDSAIVIAAGEEHSFAPPAPAEVKYATTWSEYFENGTTGWTAKTGIDDDLAALLMVLKNKEAAADVLDNANNGTWLENPARNAANYVRVKTSGRQSNLGSGSATYTFPAEFSSEAVSDYQFYCSWITSAGTGAARSSYLAVKGEKGVLAVVEIPQGTGNTAILYKVSDGALVEAGRYATDGRGTSSETGAKWYDVKIAANQTEGTTITLTLQGASEPTLDSVNLGGFDKLKSLYTYQTTDNNGVPVDWGFDDFVLKTPAAAGAPAEPVIAVVTASYAADRAVSITCETSGAKIYWSTSADGDYAEYDAEAGITVSETSTIYAYAENDAGKSDKVSLVVYANVKLNAPTLARRGWYSMLITAGANPATGVTPAYTFSYKLKGDDEASVSGSPATVKSGHGNSFNVDGTTCSAYATAEGYGASETTYYTGYTFSSSDYNTIYNEQFVGYKYTTVWTGTTMVGDDGATYRAFKENNTNNTFHDPIWFSNISTSTDYPRWKLDSGNGLYLNNMAGTILFKAMKPGTLVYVNADSPYSPVNMEKKDEYTNKDEYVYEVTGDAEVVDAKLSFTKNTYIYCIKVYEPVPAEPEGIDPATGTLEVAGDGTEDAGEVAAGVDIAVPAAVAELTGYDAEKYQANFTKSAVWNTDTSVWVVTAELAEEVATEVEETVAGLLTTDSDEVTVPLGLYYKFTAMDELGVANDGGVVSGLSDGTAVKIVKPVGTVKGFIEVKLGATDNVINGDSQLGNETDSGEGA